ncbi:MAG: Na/Pi cotransporter family protein, partial [Clostridiales bacterium]|nr:Na/Pi cotransporter family protein [Clostridiales bacterium]MCR5264955.1 Na/Pi cotransporter family protein [Clostridiales bacterium]
ITDLREQIKDGHIERLKAGQCTIEMGFVLSDLLGNMERVAAHCSNIAVCMIELQESSLNAHSYSSEVKSASEEYAGEVRRFREKYRLGSNA